MAARHVLPGALGVAAGDANHRCIYVDLRPQLADENREPLSKNPRTLVRIEACEHILSG